MTILESLPIALFIMMMVFALLGSVYALIRLSSYIIRLFVDRKKKENPPIPPAEETCENNTLYGDEEVFSSGELKLKNVDERTAAMIIAIVSDESGIPLTELCFKSIRLVEPGAQKTESKEAMS